MYSEDSKDILNRILNKIPSDVDKTEGSFIYDAQSPIAEELAQAYDKLDSVLNNAFGITASEEYLDNKVAEIGMTRKAGNKAIGTVTFTGTDGTAIPSGTLVETSDDLQFVTINDALIVNSTIDVSIQAIEVGTKYNVPAGTIINLPTQVNGVSSLTNKETTDGEDIENDDSLRQRYLTQMQTPSINGNLASYISWSKEVPGIFNVKAYPRWNGPNTIKLVLLSSGKTSPSQSKVNEVFSYIEERRPIGMDVTVIAAKEKSIDIKLHPILKDNGILEDLPNQIKISIKSYFSSIAFIDNVVRYTKVSEAILLAEDILDFENLTINNQTSNIQLADDEIPVLGAIQLI